MIVAGGELSLMNAMMSTEQDMRTAARFPTRQKRHTYHHQVHRVLSIVRAVWGEGEHGNETGGVGWTDRLGIRHMTGVRTGGRIAWERICLGAGGMP